VRAGVHRLRAYLALTTRPAAIQLLLQSFQDADFIAVHRGQMLHLVSTALPEDTSPLMRLMPLRMLQDLASRATG